MMRWGPITTHPSPSSSSFYIYGGFLGGFDPEYRTQNWPGPTHTYCTVERSGRGFSPIKGTVSRELRWVLLYIYQSIFARVNVSHLNFLILLKGHFTINKRRSSIWRTFKILGLFTIMVSTVLQHNSGYDALLKISQTFKIKFWITLPQQYSNTIIKLPLMRPPSKQICCI